MAEAEVDVLMADADAAIDRCGQAELACFVKELARLWAMTDPDWPGRELSAADLVGELGGLWADLPGVQEALPESFPGDDPEEDDDDGGD